MAAANRGWMEIAERVESRCNYLVIGRRRATFVEAKCGGIRAGVIYRL